MFYACVVKKKKKETEVSFSCYLHSSDKRGSFWLFFFHIVIL